MGHLRVDPRLAVARLGAGCASVGSRLARRGGTALPGRVLLAIDPDAVRTLASRRAERHVCVSATNGKTTLTAMLARVCSTNGRSVLHNMAGANLRSGVASTFVSTRHHHDVALLECDEAALPSIVRDVRPHVIVLGNLFRDQLDRYGELESVAGRWQRMLANVNAAQTVIAYCADDPLIAHVVREHATDAAARGIAIETVAYGCDDAAVAAIALPHAADSTRCRTCERPLTYERSFVGHLGHYRCARCGFARPEPVVRATDVELEGLGATTFSVATPPGQVTARIKVPGLYNVYNALGAIAASVALGIDRAEIESGLGGFVPAFGRFERVGVPGGGTLTLLLVKNPTGLNEVVRTLVDAGVDLTASLFALGDGIADGRDTSWVWDADVEPLVAAAPGIVATGDRAEEFALRAVYGGANVENLTVDANLESALGEVLERARATTTHGHAYALVTYTSMLRMRDLLDRKGWTTPFWQRREGA